LRRVEAWSFATATDLTEAGYAEWAPLLHGPRTPLTRAEALGLTEQLLTEARAQRVRQLCTPCQSLSAVGDPALHRGLTWLGSSGPGVLGKGERLECFLQVGR
jgi:hypothetical protein